MALCDYCQEKEAITQCDVCGSMVCREHNLDYGCRVCDGGEQKL